MEAYGLAPFEERESSTRTKGNPAIENRAKLTGRVVGSHRGSVSSRAPLALAGDRRAPGIVGVVGLRGKRRTNEIFWRPLLKSA